MSAPNEQREPSIDRLAAAWSRFVHRRAMLLLGVAGVLAGAAVWVAVSSLEFRGDRNDLIAADIPWNQDFIEWYRGFPSATDIFVAVDADTDRAAAEQVVEEIGRRLQGEPLVSQVEWGAWRSEFAPIAARLLPPPEYAAQVDEALAGAAVLQPRTVAGLLRSIAGATAGESDSTRARTRLLQLTDVVRWVGDALERPEGTQGQSPLRTAVETETWRFLESPNGRFLIIRITPVATDGGAHIFEEAVVRIRDVVDASRAAGASMDIGVTGADAIEVDETLSIIRDATVSSSIAFVLIAILVFTFARSFLLPVVLLVTLLVGMAWSLGWLVLSVGHLQLLSVVFLAVLLGLGIDFGVHFTSAMRAAAETGDASDLLAAGLSKSARGIVAGGVTTAAAFVALSLTDFSGIAELGIIAGGGLILCLVATFTVLPALIVVMDRAGARWMRPLARPRPMIDRARAVLERHGRAVWLSAIVVMAILAVVALRVRFDYDLIRLQPEGLPSTQWHQRLMAEGGVSAWYAVSVVDSVEEARRLTDAYRAMELTGRVGGIAELFPPFEQENRAIAADARARLSELEARASDGASTLPQSLQALRAAVRLAVGRLGEMPEGFPAMVEALQHEIDRCVTLADGLGPDAMTTVEAALDEVYIEDRTAVLDRIRSMVDHRDVVPGDLPHAFRTFFVNESDPLRPRYAVEVHPRAPPAGESVLARPFVDDFEQALEQVDPHVTGVLLQIARSGSLIREAFLQAGLYATAAVLVLLIGALRSVRAALVCLVPPLAGFLVALSWLVLSGGALDAANIIALPLLFGIAVDAGVHMVARARRSPDEPPLGLTHGTGWSIVLTKLTTLIGFAALIIAEHRGLRSLGMLMSVGLLTSLAVCLSIMPAMLASLHGRRSGA
jgi:hopanoid biosynthesis associated RND transporter like protein HpnN